MKKTQFLNQECIELGNDSLSLLITRSVGPRIISLRSNQGENLFAEIPDQTLECPGVGVLNLLGGHRLWHAPEDPRRTYLPDDNPVEVSETPGGVRVDQPVEPISGIAKSLTISLSDQESVVVIDHVLENHCAWTVELAPWAITQLKKGGFAILPQPTQAADPYGVLPNRLISLWPYTDITNPHISWRNEYIFIHALMERGALKLGFPNPTGWLAYWVDNTLFVKYAEYQQTAEYYDFGSSSECYCNPYFLELETLGPRKRLEPGERVMHREIWKLFDVSNLEPAEEVVRKLVDQLAI
jgi:hypothetical protein